MVNRIVPVMDNKEVRSYFKGISGKSFYFLQKEPTFIGNRRIIFRTLHNYIVPGCQSRYRRNHVESPGSGGSIVIIKDMKHMKGKKK